VTETPAFGGEVVCASWLTPRLVAMLVRVDPSLGDPSARQLQYGSSAAPIRLAPRWFGGLPDPESTLGSWLLTAALPATVTGELRLADDSGELPLAPSSLEGVVGTPAELAAQCQTELGPTAAELVPHFLAGGPLAHDVELTPELAAQLTEVRDLLRRRLPGTVVAPGPLATRLESVTQLDSAGFWLTGWIHDAAPAAVRLTAVSPEGTRREVPAGAISFHHRPAYSEGLEDDDEVSTLGFHALVELATPSIYPMGWVLEFTTAAGDNVEDVNQTTVSDQVAPVRAYIRRHVRQDPLDEEVLEHLVVPVAGRLRDAPDQPRVERMLEFGPVPAEPAVSVVVAVRRLDRIQHQLVEFVRDPMIAETEVIFVASAAKAGELEELGSELYDLYGVAFRLAELSARPRQPRALNLGARVARGQRVVLMSGDVFPARPGWIAAMASFSEQHPEAATIIPKLLREDNSIAHAGTEYERRLHPPALRRIGTFAGLSAALPAANTPRRVSGGSGACLMVLADRFHATGGFPELYLDVDEGGDLCFLLAEDGGETWYVPAAELYLLDRPEKPAKGSRVRDNYNDWLFQHRWAHRLGGDRDGAARRAPRAEGRVVTDVGPRGDGRASLLASTISGWAPTASADPYERLEVIAAPIAESGPVLDAIVRSPRDEQQSAFGGTYALWVDGWAIARDGQPLTIELLDGNTVLRSQPATLPAPKAAPRHADAPGAEACGFSIAVGPLGLALDFDYGIDAVSADGTRTALGRVTGRRRPLRSGYSPSIQPLLITQLGRSGSSWAVTLLSRHREIVAHEPLRSEAKQALFWSSVLSTLTQPTSYMKSLNSGPFAENWWVGDSSGPPVRPRSPEPAMSRWLGSRNLEVMAGVCQSRVDEFYAEVARQEGRDAPRYFVEKADPIDGPPAIAELWPDSREIILVRDFRDWVCSIIGFNSKRGLQGWLRDQTDDDVEWISQLRGSAERLLQAWQTRRDRAHLVRYEDLIADPAQTLTGICSYLGVDSSPEAVDECLMSAEKTGPEAQKAHSTSESVDASVGRWKRDMPPEHIAACVDAFDDVLAEFGYEPTGNGASASSTPSAETPEPAPS
jgi:hypothetical protein